MHKSRLVGSVWPSVRDPDLQRLSSLPNLEVDFIIIRLALLIHVVVSG